MNLKNSKEAAEWEWEGKDEVREVKLGSGIDRTSYITLSLEGYCTAFEKVRGNLYWPVLE